ncbi:MAG: PD40 domain-containing protein [Anaerolineae bacterium]|nr:PD40 domain-containing protein [Anaerolineae bacterium]
MKQLIGQTLGRYKITEFLGQGGMGAVFKAEDITLGRAVAIKLMQPKQAISPNFRERFLQEARAAAKLQHPGIVLVHDFGWEQNLLYIVMAFIPGENLEQLLERLKKSQQWISLNEAVGLTRQVCLALDYLHRQGVLHRDIKPANIMLAPEPAEGLPYRPIVTDLGLARLMQESSPGQRDIAGTPAYMSPEQALGQPTDARSDVYSLGILLYHLAVGSPPFLVNTIAEARRCHAQEAPLAPRKRNPGFPEDLERVILKALAKAPTDRFASAAELARALESVFSTVALKSTLVDSSHAKTSLITVYQQSLVEERGPSLLAEFPNTPNLGQDHIQVLKENTIVASFPMKAGGLTVGREADNDIILDDLKASRHHARLESDGRVYRITDLGSTNGTYLAGIKLRRNVPEVWNPEQTVRIGQTWLRLVLAKSAVSSSPVSAQSRVGRFVQDKYVSVSVNPSTLTITPGTSANVSIELFNLGNNVDHFHLTVSGVPETWVWFSATHVDLMPGQRGNVILTLQPPRTPESRAGRRSLVVRVTSGNVPDQYDERKITVTVAPYAQFDSSLHPQQIRNGATANVVVENQGNLPETFTLTWQDQADALHFEPAQKQLTIPEGEKATTEFRAGLRARRWVGSEKPHQFTVRVKPGQGQVREHSGDVISKGVIPAWLPPLLISFVCIILPLFATQLPLFKGGKTLLELLRPTPTVPTSPTINPVSPHILAPTSTLSPAPSPTSNLPPTSSPTPAATHTFAPTDTPTSPPTDTPTSPPDTPLPPTDTPDAHATKTAIAATQTATWSSGDDDGDGLKNGDEVTIYKTDPTDPDSDDDTLTDGTEVNSYRTNPNNDDTDGDCLKDGEDQNPLQPFGGGTGKIVFVSDRDGNKEIYSTNICGTGLINLTNNPADDFDPAWSPDGTEIAFASTRDGYSEIYVMNADGSNVRRLTHNSYLDHSPVWSPSGERIAFASGLGSFGIDAMNADGSNVVKLAADSYGGLYGDPDWSPDGKKIAYTSLVFRSGSSIYILTIANGDTEVLQSTSDTIGRIDWAPSGLRIAYASLHYNETTKESVYDIHSIGVAGGTVEDLTDQPTNDSDPAWSPDNGFIAFSSDRDGDTDIYIMDINGNIVHQVTNHSANDSQPVWQP